MPGVTELQWSPDGKLLAAFAGTRETAVVCGLDGEIHDPIQAVCALAWGPKASELTTASADGAVRVWTAGTRAVRLLGTVPGTTPRGIAWSPAMLELCMAHADGGISVYEGDIKPDERWKPYEEWKASREFSCTPCWTQDGWRVIHAENDGAICITAIGDHPYDKRWNAHDGPVNSLELSPDGKLLATTGTDDLTVRVWQVDARAAASLEGHVDMPRCARFTAGGEFLVTQSALEVLIWRCADWERVAALSDGPFSGLACDPVSPVIATGNPLTGAISVYELSYSELRVTSAARESRKYVNAKVVLLGDTGVGKTALSMALTGQSYEATDSTHARKVRTLDTGDPSREVLLWDLAGQPGYRLTHQLHLNEVTVALLVFDSRDEIDPFTGVRYWARALAQARRLNADLAVPLKTFLVAARADRGGTATSTERIQATLAELGLDGYYETSAREGWNIAVLEQAILRSIDWDALPTVSSNELFESIKRFLIAEKDRGRLLSTVDDLWRSYSGDDAQRGGFEACVGRLESRGLVRRLHFGDLVLLQPELLDAYASSLVQTAKDEPDGLGFIEEERAFAGTFRMPEDERAGDRGQERLLLIATVEELLRHEIALKEVTDRGAELVFPSQFTRERPEAPRVLGKRVLFSFDGSLASVYATLAVRLAHSRVFERKDMWRNVASYAATLGGTCGIVLREVDEGRGELVLFFDDLAQAAVRTLFETYIAEHLRLRAVPGSVTRQPIVSCPACSYEVPGDLVERWLGLSRATVPCPACFTAELNIRDEGSAPAEALAEMNASADQRRDQNAAETLMRGKIQTGDYDVFLSYNSKDAAQVKSIAERLREHGVRPWLDTEDVPAGVFWLDELDKRLKTIRAAAVFIGRHGPGPWQKMEVRSRLQALVRKKRPVIPVILPDRKTTPSFPPFLDQLNYVDMRIADPDPVERLVRGIRWTGM